MPPGRTRRAWAATTPVRSREVLDQPKRKDQIEALEVVAGVEDVTLVDLERHPQLFEVAAGELAALRREVQDRAAVPTAAPNVREVAAEATPDLERRFRRIA